jgi:hypothetical protein
VIIAVAVIAALPGLVGLIISWRQAASKRRQNSDNNASAFGTKLAETAFKNMEIQVARLTQEQARWNQDRDDWEVDKQEMLSKISNLSDQLHLTNQYLQLLLATLDGNNVPRPRPPVGYQGLARD